MFVHSLMWEFVIIRMISAAPTAITPCSVVHNNILNNKTQATSGLFLLFFSTNKTRGFKPGSNDYLGFLAENNVHFWPFSHLKFLKFAWKHKLTEIFQCISSYISDTQHSLYSLLSHLNPTLKKAKIMKGSLLKIEHLCWQIKNIFIGRWLFLLETIRYIVKLRLYWDCVDLTLT